MQKWGYFTMGIMAGIIFVLAFLLLSQQRDSLAWAHPSPLAPGEEGIFLTVGGTEQQKNDLVWVLFTRDGSSGDPEAGKFGSGKRVSLAAYRMEHGSKGRMELLSVRDITYDLEIVDWQSEPSVREIRKKLEDEAKKRDKDKDD